MVRVCDKTVNANSIMSTACELYSKRCSYVKKIEGVFQYKRCAVWDC